MPAERQRDGPAAGRAAAAKVYSTTAELHACWQLQLDRPLLPHIPFVSMWNGSN